MHGVMLHRVAVLCLSFCSAECYSIYDVHRLKTDLFNNRTYDRTIRPLLNQSQVVKVSVSMALQSIYDIDLHDGHMTCVAYVTLGWTDEQLCWNSSQYGGLDMISLPSEEIWTPRLSQSFDLSATLPFSMTEISSNGRVVWLAAGDFTAHCDINMEMYPIDTHNCDINLISSTSDKSNLQFTSMSGHINTDAYLQNGKWDLMSTRISVISFNDAETGFQTNGFTCTISIQRRPYYILLHSTMPLVCLLFLSAFVFFVPLQSGERVSFSATLFLTLIFFSTNLNDSMPQTSTRLPMVSIGIVQSMFVSGLAVLASIILCKMVHQSERNVRPWRWVRKLTVRVNRFRNGKPNVHDNLNTLDASFTTEIRSIREVDDLDTGLTTETIREERTTETIREESELNAPSLTTDHVQEPDNAVGDIAIISDRGVTDDKCVVYDQPDEESTVTLIDVAENIDYVLFRVYLFVSIVEPIITAVIYLMYYTSCK